MLKTTKIENGVYEVSKNGRVYLIQKHGREWTLYYSDDDRDTCLIDVFATKKAAMEFLSTFEPPAISTNIRDEHICCCGKILSLQVSHCFNCHRRNPKYKYPEGLDEAADDVPDDYLTECYTKDELEHHDIQAVATSKATVIQNVVSDNDNSHLVVIARAGTGKTFTLIEGLQRIKGNPNTDIVGSDQQERIWAAMQSSLPPKNILFCAFNNSIAQELETKVPAGCDAMTLHKLGFRMLKRNAGHCRVDKLKANYILEDLMGISFREICRKPAMKSLFDNVLALVGHCKQNLIDSKDSDFQEKVAGLISHHTLDVEHSLCEVCGYVEDVLERCKLDTSKVDFNDMIWLPLVLEHTPMKYDLLLVDEAQDLNRMQQELVMRSGKRIIACGDPMQAIYGFAGADTKGMDNMVSYLGKTENGVTTFPLNITYRCGKAIVDAAKEIVSDYEAYEENPNGSVRTLHFDGNRIPSNDPGVEYTVASYTDFVASGDMILCRVNAPLVSACFRFLKDDRKAYIQGRNIGEGLIKMIKKSKAGTISEFVGWLDDWYVQEERKIGRRRFASDDAMIALQDKKDCLICFAENLTTDNIDSLKAKIESVFHDGDGNGIRLSSVHKAKGLEAENVFVLLPKGVSMPHAMAKSTWQVEQEWNLKYVAITRAIRCLTWVTEGKDGD